MSWCLWVVLGAAIYIILSLFVWALCAAAGYDDLRRGRK